MLQTVQGVVRERRDVTDSARGKEVGGQRRDVTDSAREKGSFGRDVLFQTVQWECGRWGETLCYRQCKGESAVLERRDVTDSAKGKVSVWRD